MPRTHLVRHAIALSFVLPSLCLSGIASPALAQEGPVTRYLRGRHEEVSARLRDDAPSVARDTAVGAVIDDLIDFEALSRSALGAHWDEMTPAQRTEFVALLRELTRNRYLSELQHILDFEVEYGSEATITGGTLVSTSARSRTERRAEPVEIAYSMHNVGGTWRVFDVTTDSVSMVANYRRQFHSIISEHGIEGLLQRMRDRRAREAPH